MIIKTPYVKIWEEQEKKWTSTADFDGGDKVNVETRTDAYDLGIGEFRLNFPYAIKDALCISYWRMNNTLIDEVGTQNLSNWGADGQADGGPFDGCYDFVRLSNDHMTADNILHDFGLSLSACVWIKRDDTALSTWIAKDAGVAGTNMLCRADVNSWYSEVRLANRTANEDKAVVLGTGTWKLVVMVADEAEERFEMYVDGVSIHEEPMADARASLAGIGAINIGREKWL
ncbi:unnamed protein product, partial [marine sediment metagenome]